MERHLNCDRGIVSRQVTWWALRQVRLRKRVRLVQGETIMRRNIHALVVCAIGFLASLAGFNEAHAQGLECPNPGNLGRSPLEADVEQLVPKGYSLEQPSDLQSAIWLLREHGMSIDDTINHLVAYYCPAVSADAGLSHGQMVERVQQFAKNARLQVFAANNVKDIIYNVPLDPTLAQLAADAAKKKGLTVEQWIETTVESAVK